MLESKSAASQPDITSWLGNAFEVLLQLETQPGNQSSSGPMLKEQAAVIAVRATSGISV